MRPTIYQHKSSILRQLEAMLWHSREVRTLRAIMALFLDTQLKTTLQNVKIISAATASRFFSHDMLSEKLCWEELNRWQFERLYQQARSRKGRRPEIILKLDLTCIKKTGKRLPFAWCYNKSYGVQLLVLHASFGSLNLPIAATVYQGNETLVELALGLLHRFPAASWPSRVVVLTDAAFGTREFLLGTAELGFSRLLVGMRCDRKLKDDRSLMELRGKGESVRLHDLEDLPLVVSWCNVKRDDGVRRFYVVATFTASGAWLSRRYRSRWLIESFFQRVKHDFGLKEARLRTQEGMRLWFFFSCLAYSLAALERTLGEDGGAPRLTMGEAAQLVSGELLHDYRLLLLMTDCEKLSFGQQNYRLRLEVV